MSRSTTSGVGDVHILYLTPRHTRTGSQVTDNGVRCSCRQWSTWVTDEDWARELWRQHVAEATP